LIKAQDRGPVLFWQVRVGRWGREFWCPKFRSMVVNADQLKDHLLRRNDHGGDGVTFKMRRDPRVTWVGRVIRKTSIDELPQLWCVLRGDLPFPKQVELDVEYIETRSFRTDLGILIKTVPAVALGRGAY